MLEFVYYIGSIYVICVCVCVCIYVCICICIYTHTYMQKTYSDKINIRIYPTLNYIRRESEKKR